MQVNIQRQKRGALLSLAPPIEAPEIAHFIETSNAKAPQGILYTFTSLHIPKKNMDEMRHNNILLGALRCFVFDEV